MAYLSRDDITGEVFINIHANNSFIYNYADKDYISLITWIGSPRKDQIKFSNSSIALLAIFLGNKKFTSDKDFTVSLWMYNPNNMDTNQATEISLIQQNNYDSNVLQNSYFIDLQPMKKYYSTSNITNFEIMHVQNNSYSYLVSYPNNVYNFSDLADRWVHTAIVKHDNLLKVFIDGKSKYSYQFSDSDAANWFGQTYQYISISTSSPYIAYFDDLVIINDQALWTQDFDVPTDYLIEGSENKRILYPFNINKNNNIINY